MGTTKKFKVTITETLQLSVEVNAESQQQAKEIIAQRWKNSAYVLDADHFVGVEFDVLPINE